MLKIQVGTEFIRLPDQTSINFSFQNEAFNDSGSYSLLTNIDGEDPVNQKIFNFPSRVTKLVPSTKELPATLFLDNNIFSTTIKAKQSSKKTIGIFIKLFISVLIEKISNTSIRDVDFGGDIAIGNTSEDVINHLLAVNNLTYPDAKYYFPQFYNKLFYGEIDDNGNAKFNPDWGGTDEHYIINYPEVNTTIYQNVKNNKNCLVPFPYLFFVLKKIFDFLGYNPEGNFLKDTELQRLIIPNNYALDLKKKIYYTRASFDTVPVTYSDNGMHYLFPVIAAAPDEDDDACFSTGADGCGYIVKEAGSVNINYNIKLRNNNDNAVYTCTVYLFYGGVVINEHSITTHLHEFVLSFSFESFFNYVRKITAAILFTGTVDDFSVELYGGDITFNPISSCNLNRFAKTINIKNHLPNQTILEYLINLYDTFGFKTYWNTNDYTAKIVYFKDMLTSHKRIDFNKNLEPYPSHEFVTEDEPGFKLNFEWGSNDGLTSDNFKEYDKDNYIGEFITKYRLPGTSPLNKIALVKASNELYVYKLNEDTNIIGWNKYSDNFYDLLIKEGKVEKKSKISTMMNIYPSFDEELYFPAISQLGTSHSFGTGVNDFDSMLIFARGVINEIALASHTCYDQDGNKIGNYEFRWDGPEGLFEKFWKEWLLWIYNGRYMATIKKEITSDDVKKLVMYEKYRMYDSDYLISKVDFNATCKKINTATITAFKV